MQNWPTNPSAGDLGKRFQAAYAGGDAKAPRAAFFHPYNLGLAAHPVLPPPGKFRRQSEDQLQQVAILDAACGV